MFKFDCYNHDTGIDVNVWIVTEEESYQIINKTYWKSCGYNSSNSYWKKGVWDNKLDEVIKTMRDKLVEHYKKEVLSLEQELKTLQEVEDKSLSKIEGLFK
jgi:hypothetical protein